VDIFEDVDEESDDREEECVGWRLLADVDAVEPGVRIETGMVWRFRAALFPKIGFIELITGLRVGFTVRNITNLMRRR
jgi:hypothetical protein